MPFNPNRINIHELTIEEPEKQSELAFDPERDITEEDWQGMREQLETNREQSWACKYFSEQAMWMKILNPGIYLGLDKKAWKKMRDELEKTRKEPSCRSFFRQAGAMRILDSSIDLGLNNEIWQRAKDQLERYKKETNWAMFSRLAMRMKIVDPKVDIDINDRVLEGIKNELEEFRKKGEWWSFSREATQLRILDNNIDLDLKDGDWQGMESLLVNHRKERFRSPDFCEQVMQMKILAAEEVKVTGNGLEINMRKPKSKLTSGIPPLPETKQF